MHAAEREGTPDKGRSVQGRSESVTRSINQLKDKTNGKEGIINRAHDDVGKRTVPFGWNRDCGTYILEGVSYDMRRAES